MIFLITAECFLNFLFCLIPLLGKKQLLKLFQGVSVTSRRLHTPPSEVIFLVFLYNFLWIYVSEQAFFCTRAIWKVSPSACDPGQRGILFPAETLGVAMDAPISSLHKHEEGH